jgi:hypothetical protein
MSKRLSLIPVWNRPVAVSKSGKVNDDVSFSIRVGYWAPVVREVSFRVMETEADIKIETEWT